MITVDFSRLQVKPGARILDAGCGSGRHVCEASRLENVFTIGSDLNYSDTAEAKSRLEFHELVGEHGGGPWATLSSDVTSLPFPDNAFDLVICSEVLEHIPDHDKAVSELIRVLKPNKDLVVSVPRYFPERICWALSKDYYLSNGGHVRIYRKNGLIAMIEKAGTYKWAEHYAHGIHSPYWWLKCLVGPVREDSRLVNLYHRLLVWDIMTAPRLTRTLDRLLNPIVGKSLVLYFKKNAQKQSKESIDLSPDSR